MFERRKRSFLKLILAFLILIISLIKTLRKDLPGSIELTENRANNCLSSLCVLLFS